MAERSLYPGTQDISRLLAGTFEDLHTGDVTAVDMETNSIKSQGGDDVYHEAFTEELQKLLDECKCRLTEADLVEENIIQAQDRAKAEEERALMVLKADVEEDFHKMGLPPVPSSFRCIVDNELLRKNHLTCPDDYITDKLPVTRAPKGKSEPGYIKETFSFKQCVSSGSRDPMPAEVAHLQKTPGSLPNVSLLTLPSTPDLSHQTKKTSKETNALEKLAWKGKAVEESECAYLAKLEKRQNYLKNPRFFPLNTLHGGKSLVISQEKVEQTVAKRKAEDNKGDTSFVPVFLANPPTVLFSDYEVGQVYEMTIELQNITSTGHHVRLIPPTTSAFAIGPGKFPGKGGMIAPGMTCQYTVQFIPKYPGDYEDSVLVETQVSEPLLIPIQAKRPSPVLTLPHIIDCGSCLVGGIKVTMILCRNEGFNTGKFLIMPKNAWPNPNFKAVPSAGFVIQEPFRIHPAAFELAPGQSTTFQVVFFPSFPEVSQQTYTIVCDNYQDRDVTVTGVGQLVALELLFVTGGESKPEPGEVTDITAQHLIRFDPQNPHTTEEKKLVIRNSTQVELPFYWKIIKPNLKPLIPEENADFKKLKYNQDTESAFSLNPEQGVLLPQADEEFILTYTPQELKSYHSVIQMVLRGIPESPCLVKEEMLQNIPEYKVEDVIALEIEVKGSTEPFQLLLEPYAIIIPGANFIGVNVRKTFKMWNNSKSLIKYTWEKIISCDIIEVEPHTGVIDRNTCCEFQLVIMGSKPGCISYNLQCRIEHCPEPVVLHIEAAFEGPLLCIDVPSLQFGLIKQGESVLRSFEINNLCQLPARWRMQESQVCLAERNEEVSPFTIQPSAGEIPPLGTCSVSVQFTSLLCQHLQTVLELEVEDGEGSHLPVSVNVQTPKVCLISSHLVFTEVYTGVPAKATSKLFNQRLLPAQYLWGKQLIGSQAAFCSAAVSPASGTLGPNEVKEFCVDLSANIVGELKDLALCCSIEDMIEPLFLSISGEVKGLHVTYSVPCDDGIASNERQISQSPSDLLVDFGSEVALRDVVKRLLLLTNHTGISAPFRVEAEYFTAHSLTPEQGISLSSSHLVKRRQPITKHAARRAWPEFAAAVLSHGKGVAFHIQPSTGTLKPFQQLRIEITAYNNMWGEYRDDLVCQVGDLQPKLIPMQMTVKGCPIFMQMTGPQTEQPTIRFGTHVSGGSPVIRRVQLNNPSPFNIRLDWEIYNQEKDDKKLVDLLMFFGDPFPPKAKDEKETTSAGSNSESEIMLKLDQTAIPHGSIYPASQTTDEPSGTNSRQKEIVPQEPTAQKIASVLLRPHEGVPADNPYSITPRQIVVPAGGSISVCISFTPRVLPEPVSEVQCEGFLLGFMSLDDECSKTVPNKVHRKHGYGVPPLRIDLEAFTSHALLKVVTDRDRGMVFYSTASDLVPDQPLLGVLTDSVMTQSLKLINCTKVPLYFRLLLSPPFSLSSTDPKNTKTSHSKKEGREQQPQLVLYPQQNMLVKVSFHTTLELLAYQHLPDTQLLPGVQVLQFENGERKLKFDQNLVIEHSNGSRQLVPVTAYLTVPVLELSSNQVDFQTCFVAQTKTEHIFLCNRSGCRSYWTALLDEQGKQNDLQVFSVSPTNGILEGREGDPPTKGMLKISFTPRYTSERASKCQKAKMLLPASVELQRIPSTASDTDYEAIVTITGMLGEKPCKLHLRGQGTYDGKHEELYFL